MCAMDGVWKQESGWYHFKESIFPFVSVHDNRISTPCWKLWAEFNWGRISIHDIWYCYRSCLVLYTSWNFSAKFTLHVVTFDPFHCSTFSAFLGRFHVNYFNWHKDNNWLMELITSLRNRSFLPSVLIEYHQKPHFFMLRRYQSPSYPQQGCRWIPPLTQGRIGMLMISPKYNCMCVQWAFEQYPQVV